MNEQKHNITIYEAETRPINNDIGVPTISIEDNRIIQLQVHIKAEELPKWEEFRKLSEMLFHSDATFVPLEYKIEDYQPDGFYRPISGFKRITMRFMDRGNVLLAKVIGLMMEEIEKLSQKKIDANTMPKIDTEKMKLRIKGKWLI